MHDIYDDLNTENIASLKIGQWVDDKYVRDGEDLLNDRLVYRSLFPRVFKRDGTGKKKENLLFLCNSGCEQYPGPQFIAGGKEGALQN